MHIYTLYPSFLQSFIKSCWAVTEEMRWQTVLSSIFHFGQISKFKKGVTPRKKVESKFPVDMHICTLCPSLLQSFRQFCGAVSKELRWQTVFNSIFHFGQFFKFKKGVTRRKRIESKFPVICTSTWYAHYNYKVSWNSVEWFQRSCADKLFQ